MGSVEEMRRAAEQQGVEERRSPGVIIREIVQQDILAGIAKSNAAMRVALQGGTALRRAYENPRFSVDLDFASTSVGSPLGDMTAFGEGIRAELERRYGADATVAGPKSPKEGDNAPSVPLYRWVVQLKVGERDVPLLRIPVEVADVPARDFSPEMLLRPVERIGCDVMLNVCSQDEILADKVVAVAGRKYIKNRDFWDIQWLLGRGAALDLDMVRSKVCDYGMEDGSGRGLELRLERRLEELARPNALREFEEGVCMYLDPRVFGFWSEGGKMEELLFSVRKWLADVVRQLRAEEVA